MSLCYIGFSSNMFPVSTYDEAGYMMQGLTGSITPSNGSLTGLTYALLSPFTPDLATLQQCGQMLWYTASISISSAIIQVFTKNITLTLIAVFFIILYENALAPGIWPKPGIAQYTICLGLLMLGITKGATYSTKNSSLPFMLLGLVSLWVGGWARPETFYGLIVYAVILTIVFFVSAIKRQSNWQTLAVAAGAIGLYWTTVGFGVNSRSWMAFGQHYALGLSEQNLLLPGEDNWYDWLKITQRDFPGAQSIADAFQISPKHFTAHVISNIHKFFSQSKTSIIVSLSLVVLCMTAYSISYRKIVKLRLYDWLLLTAAPISFITPVLLSVVIIYPRTHYFATISLSALYFLGSFGACFALANGTEKQLKEATTSGKFHRIKSTLPFCRKLTPLIIVMFSAMLYRIPTPLTSSSMENIQHIRLFIQRSGVNDFYFLPAELFSVYFRNLGINAKEYNEEDFSQTYKSKDVCLVIRAPFIGERSKEILEKFGKLLPSGSNIYCSMKNTKSIP